MSGGESRVKFRKRREEEVGEEEVGGEEVREEKVSKRRRGERRLRFSPLMR